jgi:hypothetical protein
MTEWQKTSCVLCFNNCGLEVVTENISQWGQASLIRYCRRNGVRGLFEKPGDTVLDAYRRGFEIGRRRKHHEPESRNPVVDET